MKIRYIFYLAVFVFIASCKPEVSDFTPSNGTADFTTYVAVGNSLTAGYADGALYKTGQMYGWANILGQQLTTVGGGQFVYPAVSSEFGVLPGKLKLGFSTDCLDVTSLGPVSDAGELDPYYNHIDYAVNNVGVPGAKVFHLLANGYGNPDYVPLGLANPYFAKFSASANISVLEQAVSMSPTFFSLWIGNNDVLGYATSGGAGDSITGTAFFGGAYNALVTTLTAGNAKGVLANIPSVTSAAFFTTIPYNVIDIPEDGQWMVDMLNAAYAPYNAAMEANQLPYRISFQLGPNPMVIKDPDMAGLPAQLQIRQMTENELALLTLPQDSIKCATWGSAVPVPTQYILTENEIGKIDAATTAFNDIIKTAAVDKGLAFVDVNSIMKEVSASGLTFDGISFSPAFVTGNLFSLDGIHLTPQGNAVIANYFIDAINGQYSANIPKVAVTSYPAIPMP
jgi:lysophospholipase L1-like esterase